MKVQLRKKKLSDGTLSLYLDYSANGKRIRETLQIYIYKNDPDAKEKKILSERIRAQRELEIPSENYGFIPVHKKGTDFIAYFESFNKAYKKKDVGMFRIALSHLKKFYGQDTLPRYLVTEKLCKAFREYLSEKLNGETPHALFKRFTRVIKAAVKDKIFHFNPAEEIVNTNASDGKLSKEVLSEDEIVLINKFPCINSEVKRAFLFACFTGMRGVDVRGLTWERIDIKQERINLNQSKTDKQNFLPLNYTAIKLLGTEKDQGKVFSLPTIAAVNHALKKWMTAAKIKKHITFHCARHSTATNLMINGYDLIIVSKILGHTTTKHTQKYAHVADKMKRKGVDSLVKLDI